MKILSTRSAGNGRGLGRVFALAACLLGVCISQAVAVKWEEAYIKFRLYYGECLTDTIAAHLNANDESRQIVLRIGKASYEEGDIHTIFTFMQKFKLKTSEELRTINPMSKTYKDVTSIVDDYKHVMLERTVEELQGIKSIEGIDKFFNELHDMGDGSFERLSYQSREGWKILSANYDDCVSAVIADMHNTFQETSDGHAALLIISTSFQADSSMFTCLQTLDKFANTLKLPPIWNKNKVVDCLDLFMNKLESAMRDRILGNDFFIDLLNRLDKGEQRAVNPQVSSASSVGSS